MLQPSTNYTKLSYIDKTGKVIIDASKYDRVSEFSDGLASVYLENKGWGYIDKAGNEVIKPQFASAGDFSKGLAEFQSFPEGLAKFQSLSEGLAEFQRGSLYGFIDKTGRVVITLQFKATNKFSEGGAVVLNLLPRHR